MLRCISAAVVSVAEAKAVCATSRNTGISNSLYGEGKNDLLNYHSMYSAIKIRCKSKPSEVDPR